ncbi:hypothetical protein ACG2LH_11060 [Zhouia sp. PK063]|uniref:hypothetical protein n=1 Tax=Zhouia sp. PK063 TaxID=3373602 RepID=UPI0037B41522
MSEEEKKHAELILYLMHKNKGVISLDNLDLIEISSLEKHDILIGLQQEYNLVEPMYSEKNSELMYKLTEEGKKFKSFKKLDYTKKNNKKLALFKFLF